MKKTSFRSSGVDLLTQVDSQNS